jgi:hypothetical protein
MQITTVTYQAPTFVRTQLGSKPGHVFDQNQHAAQAYVACQGDRCDLGSEKVWGDIPNKNPDGTPQLTSKTVQLDLTPRSPWKYAMIAGLIGTAVGATVGALTSGAMGLATGLGATFGGLGLGTAAGGIAALAVKGDKVKTVWDTHEIKDPKMVGYHEMVGPGESDGTRGYFHRFVPDIQAPVIGSYQIPRAVHYKDESKEPKS